MPSCHDRELTLPTSNIICLLSPDCSVTHCSHHWNSVYLHLSFRCCVLSQHSSTSNTLYTCTLFVRRMKVVLSSAYYWQVITVQRIAILLSCDLLTSSCSKHHRAIRSPSHLLTEMFCLFLLTSAWTWCQSDTWLVCWVLLYSVRLYAASSL